MIRGVGVDIVEIERVGKSIRDWGDHFLQKIFTPHEVAYCLSKKNSAQHFAARFAAKEALSKAVATGWAGEFRWHDVEVMNEPSGKPTLALSGAMGALLHACTVHVSLSHAETYVVAMVIVEER